MDWREATEQERAMPRRVVTMLFALAGLAERASGRSQLVRSLVLWILRPAEAAARDMVTGIPAPILLGRPGTSPADALSLARRFRDLACELACQISMAFAACDDDCGQDRSAALWRARTTTGLLKRVRVLAVLDSAGNGLCPAALPDTS